MNVNLDSSDGAKRRIIPLKKERINIKMIINLYHKSILAFFFLNKSPSLELLINMRSFSDSIPKAEKRSIKLKERKVKISEYSYIKRNPSFLFINHFTTETHRKTPLSIQYHLHEIPWLINSLNSDLLFT